MKNLDQSLERLLRSASLAAGEPLEEIPFGFATRVSAQWKGAGGRDPFASPVALFHRALLCACIIMAVSVGWTYKTDTAAPANEEVALASYDASADLP